MIKYIIAFLLLTEPAMAETVKIKSCVGTSCKTKTVNAMTYDQAIASKPKMYCELGSINYQISGDTAFFIAPTMLYGTDKDCE